MNISQIKWKKISATKKMLDFPLDFGGEEKTILVNKYFYLPYPRHSSSFAHLHMHKYQQSMVCLGVNNKKTDARNTTPKYHSYILYEYSSGT